MLKYRVRHYEGSWIVEELDVKDSVYNGMYVWQNGLISIYSCYDSPGFAIAEKQRELLEGEKAAQENAQDWVEKVNDFNKEVYHPFSNGKGVIKKYD